MTEESRWPLGEDGFLTETQEGEGEEAPRKLRVVPRVTWISPPLPAPWTERLGEPDEPDLSPDTAGSPGAAHWLPAEFS